MNWEYSGSSYYIATKFGQIKITRLRNNWYDLYIFGQKTNVMAPTIIKAKEEAIKIAKEWLVETQKLLDQ